MGTTDRRARRQLWWAAATAAAVVATVLAVPTSGGARTETLGDLNEAEKAALGLPHVDPPGAPPHSHADPRTKNALSRGSAVGAATSDPTSAAERRSAAAYVAQQRRMPDPRLTTVAVTAPRERLPRTRYAMAGGCYTMRVGARHVVTAPDGLAVSAVPARRAARAYFKATDLGTYLLHAGPGRFVAGTDGVALDPAPGPAAEWTARRVRGAGAPRYTLTRLQRGGARQLAVGRGGRLVLADRATGFVLERAGGCRAFPEAQVGVRGRPHAGLTPYQEVRGFVDGHSHGMAFEFLGGSAHCGRPWHRYGVAHALRDCPDHELTNGSGAVLETFLSGVPRHDPVGWPTFRDWPAPESLTHEGTYYRWLERAWRGGQRLFVNLLVENNKLCELYPLKRNSCDDMDSVRLQARRMREMERYVDAQAGGPGKGFYRIVTDPWQARRVINQGKMAVVMGIETSVPFGCTFKAVLGSDVPACDARDIDRQLTEMHRLGVRQMELVNKFDNALAGVAGDEGTTGVAVNAANFLETGSFWDMRHCEPADGRSADRTQLGFPAIAPQQQDALFGAVAQVFGGVLPALPLYGPPLHCNRRGLTTLGEHTIRGLAARRMIFDPDHLSVKARQDAMRVVERLRYPGVISSHSWSTPDTYPRIYRSGGFITPYAGDSTGFVQKWRRHLGWADRRYYFGFGFGADINGLGAQGAPRGAGVANAVTYPFRGLNGVVVQRQRAGRRTYDINVDGVAQYGLYPDWVQDLRRVAGRDGAAIVDDMARGAEAYLQMWERAEGVRPDSCRNPGLRRTVAAVQRLLRPGLSHLQVLRRVGQPYTRLGSTYGFCAKRTGPRADPRVMVRVDLDRRGRLARIRVGR